MNGFQTELRGGASGDVGKVGEGEGTAQQDLATKHLN